MKRLLETAALLGVGFITGCYVISKDVNAGEVVYEDDEKYVQASESRSYGWSYARVHWKNPQ